MKSNILIFVAVWLIMLLYTWYRHNEQQKKIKRIQSQTKKFYEQKGKKGQGKEAEKEGNNTRGSAA